VVLPTCYDELLPNKISTPDSSIHVGDISERGVIPHATDSHDLLSPASHVVPFVDEPHDSPVHVVPLRKTRRLTRQSIWMKDYTAPGKGTCSKYPLASHLSYNNVSSHYHSYLAKFSSLVEPQTFKQAVKDDK